MTTMTTRSTLSFQQEWLHQFHFIAIQWLHICKLFTLPWRAKKNDYITDFVTTNDNNDNVMHLVFPTRMAASMTLSFQHWQCKSCTVSNLCRNTTRNVYTYESHVCMSTHGSHMCARLDTFTHMTQMCRIHTGMMHMCITHIHTYDSDVTHSHIWLRCDSHTWLIRKWHDSFIYVTWWPLTYKCAQYACHCHL